MSEHLTTWHATQLARVSGYYVRQGSYQGTPDDRLGRWYVGRAGHDFRPWGCGYASRTEAWEAAAAAAIEAAHFARAVREDVSW